MADYHKQGKLRFWCQMVLPLVYDNSLSYMELLNKVVTYLNNCIQDVGNCETNIESLLEAFVNLQDYVNEIAEDISPLIEEKLDEMIESGEFGEILADVLATVVAPEYASSESYVPLNYAIKDGTLYCCTNNTTGEWDSTKWRETTVGDELNTLMLRVYALNAGQVSYDESATYSDDTVGKKLNEINGLINDISTTTNTLFTLDGLQIGTNGTGLSVAARAISADIYCPDGITVKAAYLPTNLKYCIECYSADDLSTRIAEYPADWITDNDPYTTIGSVIAQHFRILFASVDNNALTSADFEGLILQINNGNKLEITAKDKDARLTANEAKNTADCAEDALENWGDALVSLTWHYNTTTVPANDGVTVMPNNSAEKLSRWYFIGINQIVTGSKKLLIRGVVGYSGELNLVNISDTDIDFAGNMQVRFFDPLVLQNFFA